MLGYHEAEKGGPESGFIVVGCRLCGHVLSQSLRIHRQAWLAFALVISMALCWVSSTVVFRTKSAGRGGAITIAVLSLVLLCAGVIRFVSENPFVNVGVLLSVRKSNAWTAAELESLLDATQAVRAAIKVSCQSMLVRATSFSSKPSMRSPIWRSL